MQLTRIEYTGRKVYKDKFSRNTWNPGDIMLVIPSEFLEGEYSPLETMESIHVRFVERETAFQFVKENAGRWWWRSAITPRKSSKTLGPVVKLPAR